MFDTIVNKYSGPVYRSTRVCLDCDNIRVTDEMASYSIYQCSLDCSELMETVSDLKDAEFVRRPLPNNCSHKGLHPAQACPHCGKDINKE